MDPTSAPAPGRQEVGRRDERGAGLLSTLLGVLFFVGFLLIVVQVTSDLYWRSQVRLVAFDAARRAAEGGPGGVDQGDAVIDHLLGTGATRAWSSNPDEVTVTVSIRRASPVVRVWTDAPFTATATVRRERFREPGAG